MTLIAGQQESLQQNKALKHIVAKLKKKLETEGIKYDDILADGEEDLLYCGTEESESAQYLAYDQYDAGSEGQPSLNSDERKLLALCNGGKGDEAKAAERIEEEERKTDLSKDKAPGSDHTQMQTKTGLNDPTGNTLE